MFSRAPVAAAAEAPKCVDGDLGLLQRDADDVEAAITEQKFDVPPTRFTLATLYHKGKFDPAHRQQPYRGVGESARQDIGVRFSQENDDQCRSIGDH